MPLKLTITSYQRLSPDQEASKTLDCGSLTIGRAAQSDWVLQDPERILSKLHGIVEYKEGVYFLTDRSQNGIFHNDDAERMPKNQAIRINDGDRFTLGEYEIAATFQDEADNFSETGSEGPSTDLLPPGSDLFGLPTPPVDAPTPVRVERASPIDPVPFNDLLSGEHVGGRFQYSAGAVPGTAATARPPDLSAPERINFELPSLISRPPVGKEHPRPPLLSEAAPTDPVPASAFEKPSDSLNLPEPAANSAQPPAIAPLIPPESVQGIAQDLAQESPADLARPTSEPLIPEDWWSQPPAAPLSPTPIPPLAPPAIPAQSPPPRIAPASQPSPTLPVAAPQQAPPSLPTSAAAVAPSTPRADILLRAFCEGAGLPHLKLTEEQMHRIMANLGGMLRETVRGLMEILLARSNIKGEFQLDRTSMGPIDNNPLKTPPGRPPLSPEEVMVLLLVGQKDAYMLPVQAVREGFDDIKAHQLAVVAGIQAALTRLLQRFDPDNLETRLEQSVLDNLWPANRKAKYWDLFTTEYEAIAHEAEDDFKKLFGDEFARAYENQLRL